MCDYPLTAHGDATPRSVSTSANVTERKFASLAARTSSAEPITNLDCIVSFIAPLTCLRGQLPCRHIPPVASGAGRRPAQGGPSRFSPTAWLVDHPSGFLEFRRQLRLSQDLARNLLVEGAVESEELAGSALAWVRIDDAHLDFQL